MPARRGKPLAEMMKDVVEAFVDAKMERTDISAALYRIAAEVGGPALARRMGQRSQKALEAMLRTAPDAVLRQKFAIQMCLRRWRERRDPCEVAPAMVQTCATTSCCFESYMVAATQPSALT